MAVWKQIYKGRAIRKEDQMKGAHVVQVVDLDEGIWEIVASLGKVHVCV